MIEAHQTLTVDPLASVLRPDGLEESLAFHHVASRSRSGDTVIQPSQEYGLGSPARVTGQTDDVRMRQFGSLE